MKSADVHHLQVRLDKVGNPLSARGSCFVAVRMTLLRCSRAGIRQYEALVNIRKKQVATDDLLLLLTYKYNSLGPQL